MAQLDPANPFQSIEVTKIRTNTINPRGPDVRENDPHRENLKESIAEFGILVPLVVRQVTDDQYELIDGERRYWAAKSLRISKLPAYVIRGDFDPKTALQRMFHIHMNRDQWDAVQQCKAFESLLGEIREKRKGDTEGIIDDIARFTGSDRRTARNRLQFLRWPEEIKQDIYANPKKHDSYWYVVEIEDKIVEPAQKNYPEYFKTVAANDVRKFLYRKWEENTVKAAVDVRQASVIARSPIREKAGRKKALKILDRLVRDVDLTYEDAYKEFIGEFPELIERKLPKPRALVNSIRSLTDVITQYEPEFLKTQGKRRTPHASDVSEAIRALISAAQAFLKKMKTR